MTHPAAPAKPRRALLITGAGSGIGRATARHFADRGWLVGLADVNTTGLAQTEAMLPVGSARSFTLDVRDRDGWRDTLAAFFAETGRLDLLFNNAGIAMGGRFVDVALEDHDRVLAVNLTGVMNGAAAAFPYLKQTPGSALVNTCSAAGLLGIVNLTSYAASKFAVRGFSEALDQEWAEFGIRVRTIMPGFIDTPLLDAPAEGRNMSIRDILANSGTQLIAPEAVAAAVEAAAQSPHVHHTVGPLANRIGWLTRIMPRRLHKKLRDQALAGGHVKP